MKVKGFDQRWNALAADVLLGMKDWRVAHPRATLREIEAALDERRARMLEDLALASPAADWDQAPENEHPVCPQCGERLQRESRHTRQVQTQGGQGEPLRLRLRWAGRPIVAVRRH